MTVPDYQENLYHLTTSYRYLDWPYRIVLYSGTSLAFAANSSILICYHRHFVAGCNKLFSGIPRYQCFWRNCTWTLTGCLRLLRIAVAYPLRQHTANELCLFDTSNYDFAPLRCWILTIFRMNIIVNYLFYSFSKLLRFWRATYFCYFCQDSLKGWLGCLSWKSWSPSIHSRNILRRVLFDPCRPWASHCSQYLFCLGSTRSSFSFFLPEFEPNCSSA